MKNKNKYLKIIVVILVIFYPSILLSKSLEILYTDSSNTNKSLGKYIEILEDETNSFNIQNVVNIQNFITSISSVPNIPATTSSFWLKLKVKNNSNSPNLVLKLDYPLANEVKFYSIDEGSIDSVVISKKNYFGERKYKDQSFIFDLNLPVGKSKLYFLKINSTIDLLFPIYIGTQQKIFEQSNLNNLISGIYFGLMLIMLLYNLFIFFTVRDLSYLYYVLYIAFIGLTQASFFGFANMYFWPDNFWLRSHSIFIIGAFSGVFGMLFLKEFLNVKETFPSYNRGFYLLSFLYLISFALSLNNNFDIAFNVINMTAMFVSLYMLYVGFRVWRKGYKPASFFLIAQTLFLFGVIIFALRNFGIIPFNNFTHYILQIGSGIETVLLSFSLADRINILKKEKEESQAQALAALRENERIIKERNKILDQQVQEKTADLQNSNKKLEKTLRNLQDTQAQLVNSEKMASLGLLTAGMAHEINNPINFVISSVNPLRRDFSELLNVIDKYEEVDESNFKEKTKEIKEYKEDLDLEYIKGEIESLIQGIGDGANRTAEIVKGLKTFSRIDEMDLKRVDLNEGIDSTLILLISLMNNKIVVEKNYENAEPIECYAGKINQVFMNILSNSIYAIFKKGLPDNQGKISISTREKGDHVIISIKDNGVGIPEEVKNKIFDPFFTTKDVGEGTGLGLSITYNIIESHNGKIDVVSEVGKGSEFIITLPKLQTNK